MDLNFGQHFSFWVSFSFLNVSYMLYNYHNSNFPKANERVTFVLHLSMLNSTLTVSLGQADGNTRLFMFMKKRFYRYLVSSALSVFDKFLRFNKNCHNGCNS